MEARIKALKDEIGTVHTPKKASVVYAEGVAKEETPLIRPMSVRLEEVRIKNLKNKK